MKPLRFSPGDRFGSLTIVRLVCSGLTGSFWLCRCDCGGSTVRRATLLNRRGQRQVCSRCQSTAAVPMPQMAPELVERFLREVRIVYDASPGGACWLWTGQVDRKGYGRLRRVVGGREMHAHRFSWMLHLGPVPHGLMVMHVCDRPACVNPAHLVVGCGAANVFDMVRKGRSGKAHAKLDTDALALIRTSAVPAGELAARFGVTPQTVRRVRQGLTWKESA